MKDDQGAITNWELELGSPNGLMRRGWTRNYLVKDGSKRANARRVTLSDGGECLQVRLTTAVQPSSKLNEEEPK